MRNACATKARSTMAMMTARPTRRTVSTTARLVLSFTPPTLRADGALFFDLRGLPAEIAQVVQLGPADVAQAIDLDLADDRRVHRERALDADAEAHLADRERLAHAAALPADDHALEDQESLARPLADAHLA